MAYDMTLGNVGYGFGGGSGLGGFLGNLGNAWHDGWHNNMRFATDLYNFQDQNAVRPSQVMAHVGANNVAIQDNQRQYQDLVTHNSMWNLNNQQSAGLTANTMSNTPTMNGINHAVQQGINSTANPPSAGLANSPYYSNYAQYGVNNANEWASLDPARRQAIAYQAYTDFYQNATTPRFR